MEARLREQLDAALKLLGGRSDHEREEGAAILIELAFHGEASRNEARAHLVGLLADAQPLIRAMACEGLAAYGVDPELHARWVSCLRDADPRVRRQAARTLSTLEDEEAREPLREALGDADAIVRFEAATGLAALSDDLGFDVLVAALDNRMLRFAALVALGKLADPRARPEVERIFRKFFVSDFERTQAAGVLAGVKVDAGKQHLLDRIGRRRADDRGLAIELCGEHGVKEAIPVLRETMRREGDHFRGAAARSLGMLGAEASEEVLGALVVRTDEPIEVRLDALEGLMFLGSARALEILREQAARGEPAEIREAAAEAIAWTQRPKRHR